MMAMIANTPTTTPTTMPTTGDFFEPLDTTDGEGELVDSLARPAGSVTTTVRPGATLVTTDGAVIVAGVDEVEVGGGVAVACELLDCEEVECRDDGADACAFATLLSVPVK